MNITEVPQVLFQEFSQKLGQGEEKKIRTDGFNYLLRELNPEAAGFPGAIGFREDTSPNGPFFTFVLWGILPRGKDDIFEPKPVLKIVAGPEDAGEWAYGSGCRIKEICKADFSFYGINFKNPSTQLILSIIQRASELVSEVQAAEHWQEDRNPKGVYTRPPR